MSETYTLDSLLRVEAETEWNGHRFYLRTMGSRQDELRQAAALSHARQYRKKLRDKTTAEHAIYVLPLADAERSELLSILETAQERRLAQTALEEVPPEGEGFVPEDGELKDVLDAEDEQERIDKETVERQRAWIAEKLAAWKAEMEKLSDDDVRKDATEEHIGNLAARAYSDRFNDTTLLYAVFSDKKHAKPFFKSQDDLDNVPSELKLHLLREYLKLDEASRNPGVLKNLLSGQ